MAGVIILSDTEIATNTDILQGTLLQTVSANGTLTFAMQAADAVAANNYTATIQLPSGDVPLNAQLVPGGATAGLAGILDDRLMFLATFLIVQGGHCVFSCIETGDTEMTWRVQFTPARRRR